MAKQAVTEPIKIMYSTWLNLIAHIPTQLHHTLLYKTVYTAGQYDIGFHDCNRPHDQLLTNAQGRILIYQLL